MSFFAPRVKFFVAKIKNRVFWLKPFEVLGREELDLEDPTPSLETQSQTYRRESEDMVHKCTSS